MTQMQIATINFQGEEILSFFDGETAYVAIKPICDHLGLSWHGQLERIKRHPILSEGIRVTRIPSQGGTQETTLLTIEAMHGWLLTLSLDRLTPETRALVLPYQKESFKAVYNYWVKGSAINSRFAKISASTRLAQINQMFKIVACLKKAESPAERSIMEAVLAASLESLNIHCPDLSQIGRVMIAMAELSEPFFELLDQLDAIGAKYNHHRNPVRIAVNLKELEALALTYGLSCDLGKRTKEALKAHPRFIDACAVNGRDGKSVHCWVFQSASIH